MLFKLKTPLEYKMEVSVKCYVYITAEVATRERKDFINIPQFTDFINVQQFTDSTPLY
jgi:hypothetical protein